MVDVVKWCLELGVTTVSVYAFSIENFKRSKDEVTYLMSLSAEKYQEIVQVGLQPHHVPLTAVRF
jgi:undecaprenyl diphosphate synthase